MKKLIVSLLLFVVLGCAEEIQVAEVQANETVLRDLGFTTRSKQGFQTSSLSCQDYEVAISSGCNCGIESISKQYISRNTGHCSCTSGANMEVFVICASLKY